MLYSIVRLLACGAQLARSAGRMAFPVHVRVRRIREQETMRLRGIMSVWCVPTTLSMQVCADQRPRASYDQLETS